MIRRTAGWSVNCKLCKLIHTCMYKLTLTRMKVTPPLAVAPIAQEDDMRWNPNDDGIGFNP